MNNGTNSGFGKIDLGRHIDEIKTRLGQSGMIVIPTEYRRRLGLKTGDEIIMHLDEEGLHIYTLTQTIARSPKVEASPKN
jgi:AbrB family looped-hinge helix DNA binding protein